jgi:hypothetical protein
MHMRGAYCCSVAYVLRAIFVGVGGGVVSAVDLVGISWAVGEERGGGEGRGTESMASLTRALLIRPLLKRLLMRSLFVAPELRHAMFRDDVTPGLGL